MPPAATIRTRLRAASGQPEARLLLAEQLAGSGAGAEAMRHITAAAKAGLPAAQARLGLCYLRGNGVPANMAEARHWLERAAAAHDVTAQTELASLALRGISGPYQRGPFTAPEARLPAEPDNHLAAELARRAADAGSPEAQALLAYILNIAPSLATKPNESDELYQESAEAGWPLGQLGHAMALLRENTPETLHQAHTHLTAAAETGLPTAHFLLGAMAEAGVGVDQSPDIATAHYRIAAEHGQAAAKTRLGLALMTGRGTTLNLIEAETWLRRAALDGDVIAAAVLGDFHASRQPPNLSEAARWYRQAAESGHAGSARVLASAISSGAEGRPDQREVATWLEAAIEGGETAAWADLGRLIASSSLPPDVLPALHEWLQRMIRDGRPEAGYYVGVCVNSGIGTPANLVLARRYYLWAAGEGVVEAMVAAAEMLLNGRGGPANPDLARALFEYAAKRDHPGAIYALGVLAGNSRANAMAHFRRAASLGNAKARLHTERETERELAMA